MAFNNWPYTNFQDLNLGWILSTYKSALNKALEALGKANAVEAEVGTYSDRIATAETTANGAYSIANMAREEAADAQSDATSGIAIGQAAQSTANSALSAANAAADSADEAVDSATDAARDAATALQLANLASEDYLNVGITVFPSNPAQATKNADEILTAVTANKKIKFTLDDARNGETHTTYDYTIDPVDNTASDIDINVIFDVSVSSSLNKYIVVTLHKVVSGGNTTYSITSTDVSFSGGGGGGISIQDVIDTVNDGDTDALLYTAQTLTAAEKAQVKQNLGISGDGGSYSPYLIPVTQSGGVYSTTATGDDVFEHILDCRIVFNGLYYYQIGSDTSGPFGNAYFACIDPSKSGQYDVEIFDIKLNGTSACTVTRYEKDVELLSAPPIVDTATGDPASITDGASHYPLKSLIANIDPVQSGSGDPSPTNVRPITGWTTIRITKAITGDSGYWDITLPSEAGVVYGGTLDVVNGVLTVTHAFAVLDGTQNISWENWRSTETSTAWQYDRNTFNIKKVGRNTLANVISNKLKSASYNQIYGATISDCISASPSDVTQNYSIIVRVSNPSLTTKELINAYLAENPIQVCYELDEPVTYQINPLVLYTTLGRNGFSADSGAVTVEYYADTKLYIQKLVATNANNRTSVTEVKEKPEIVLKETESEEKSEETPDEEITEETEP